MVNTAPVAQAFVKSQEVPNYPIPKKKKEISSESPLHFTLLSE